MRKAGGTPDFPCCLHHTARKTNCQSRARSWNTNRLLLLYGQAVEYARLLRWQECVAPCRWHHQRLLLLSLLLLLLLPSCCTLHPSPGTVLCADERFRDWFGISSKELVGRSISSMSTDMEGFEK